MPYMECRHIKNSGCKCQAPALRGKSYCYYHMRLHRIIRARKADPEPSPDVEIDIPAVEDTHSIRFALTEILRGLGAKRIDPRRAGRMLYGLQIAAKMVENSLFSSHSAVQSLTTTRDGDELAHKRYRCEEGDDCNECPFYNDCGGLDEEDEEDEDRDEGAEDEEQDGREENGQPHHARKADSRNAGKPLSEAMTLKLLKLLPKSMSQSIIAQSLKYAT